MVYCTQVAHKDEGINKQSLKTITQRKGDRTKKTGQRLQECKEY